ncbi:MAG: glycine cleavage system aminomethyltransferase GcvT [Prochlorothrix sp.]
MTSSSTPRRTPLYDRIQTLKPRMTEFGGWAMPIQFTGLVQEHQAVREAAGIFDISHMAKFVLRGSQVMWQLDTLVPTDLSTLKPGKAQYTVLLNETAGIIDDVIIYPQGAIGGEEIVIIIANAATAAKDKAWLETHLVQSHPDHPIQLQDWSASHVLLALQGPQAQTLLQPFVSGDLSQIPRFGHQQLSCDLATAKTNVWVARTGYTGEDGFELMTTPDTGLALWSALLDAGVSPCGLGARDTLRLEAAMGLYGQDMDETTTPLEAGLGWLVHLDRKGDFVGRDRLQQQKESGVSRRLVGLEMEGRHIARHDYAVLKDGERIGVVTSGTWAPTLQKAIALAFVPPQFGSIGQGLTVEIRGKACAGQVVKRPFYKRST